MRRRLPVALAVVGLVAAAASLFPGAAGAEPVRYLDRVFEEVDVTRDLVYGEGALDGGGTEVLRLDLYEPRGDPATARPAVVWMHGYGAASDDKGGGIDVEIATRFAKHGVVVVSIDYRISTVEVSDPAPGAEDMRTAVAWLRANAASYRIDVDRIAAAGQSAGGQRVAHGAYDPVRADGQPAPETRVGAVLSFSGNGPTDTFEPGEPPLFMANGALDTIVTPASARATCDGAKAAGIRCDLHLYADADHITLLAHADEIEAEASAFLYDVLDLANAQDPPRTTTTSTTTSTTTTTTVVSVPTAPPARPIPTASDLAG